MKKHFDNLYGEEEAHLRQTTFFKLYVTHRNYKSKLSSIAPEVDTCGNVTIRQNYRAVYVSH